MKNHGNLYTTDTTGNVRVWYMESNGAKYRTVSGVQGGVMVPSDWTTAVGKNKGKKNATTGAAQAVKEVEARYKKQRKTGYGDTVESGVASYVEPMLAKKYDDYRDKINFFDGGWGAQCKFNGMRCIATKDGLYSRKGERYVTCGHIEKALRPIFEACPSAVFDGELFNEDFRQSLNEISKLVRKTVNVTPEDLSRAAELVKFYVYDGYSESQNESTPYSIRKDAIDLILSNTRSVELVPTVALDSQETLDKFYNDLVSKGHEGAMLRNLRGAYEHKRSKNLLKMKPVDDAEFIVVDIQEGNGNWAGKAKVIALRGEDGKQFNASLKGTMEHAAKVLLDKDKYIGKKFTVQYNGLTGLGTPNFAQLDLENQPHA